MDREQALMLIMRIEGRLRSVLNGTQRISHLNRISLNLSLLELRELEDMLQGDDGGCSHEWYAECDRGTFQDDA